MKPASRRYAGEDTHRGGLRRPSIVPWLMVAIALASGATATNAVRAAGEAEGEAPASPAASHGLFTALLADHVERGRVDYAALQDDERLARYIEQLQNTNPQSIRDSRARLAFWINVYNAYTLLVVAENYPIASINDLHFGGLIIGHVLNKTVWDRRFVAVGDTVLTLDEVEHDIIREQWDEPRIHFALVCAALSCPPLRAEAFEGATLDSQLEDQARTFLADRLKNFFIPEQKTAYLSKIFAWYRDDFGADDTAVLSYVARFLPEELAAAIRSAPDEWKIEHTKYYWELNDRRAR